MKWKLENGGKKGLFGKAKSLHEAINLLKKNKTQNQTNKQKTPVFL